jgi:hypothetical protein
MADGTLKVGTITTSSGSGTITIPSGVSLSGGALSTPAFYAYLSSSAQTISNGSATKMSMNTELFDSDGTYDHSTNYRFTPATSGKYFITAQLRTGDTADFDAFQIMIYKNGSENRFAATINNNNNSVAINTIVDSDNDDYFEIYCYHNKGSNLDISTGANNTFFGAYKIGV